MMRRKNLGMLLLPVIVAAVLILFLTGLSNLDRDRSEKGRQQLEEALRRGAVACYAAEGIYPPNLEYLEEHYGVQVDEERYAVFYEVFASNLMPDITVLERDE